MINKLLKDQSTTNNQLATKYPNTKVISIIMEIIIYDPSKWSSQAFPHFNAKTLSTTRLHHSKNLRNQLWKTEMLIQLSHLLESRAIGNQGTHQSLSIQDL